MKLPGKSTVRRVVIAALALVFALLLLRVALTLSAPLLSQPLGPDRYPAPDPPRPSGCDAYVALSQVEQPANMREVSLALAEARKPWTDIDRTRFGLVAPGLVPAVEAFDRVKSCPDFEDGRGQVGIHHVLRAVLLSLVARELDAPGTARDDLVRYARLVSVRARDARSMQTLRSALDVYAEALPLLARAGVARPSDVLVDRRRDGGRMARLELAPCRLAAAGTKARVGFDPGRTYAGCVRSLGPWIEHFEHDAPQPPDVELTVTPPSWRNADGDQLADAYALAATMLRGLSSSFDRAAAAEKLTPDPR